MIIECPGCHTRFNLNQQIDPQRTTLKLRCSRCKNVFTAPVPGAPAPPPPPVRGIAIAISNQKGGVAKTSTCLNLGVALAQAGKRVLLVDFDIQGNLTSSLGVRPQRSLHSVAGQDPARLWDVILQTDYENVWLLPSHPKMALLGRQPLNGQKPMSILKEFLEHVRTDFDYILIDTPPAIEFFTLNAMIAADSVIIPSQCETFSIHGVDQMEKAIKFIREKKMLGIDYRVLVTMFDEAKTASRVIHEHIKRRFGRRAFQTVIEMDGKVSESQIVGKPVFFYDPESRVARQYSRLAAEIMRAPRRVAPPRRPDGRTTAASPGA